MADDKDIFGRKPIQTLRPILADMCIILWSGSVLGGTNTTPEAIAKATNVSLTYQQSVTRRRTLSGHGNVAVIIPSQPIGSLSIQRLIAEALPGATTKNLFDLPGWKVCNGLASIELSFNGESAYADCTLSGGSYRLEGGTVTGYNIVLEAEGLTVTDNVQVEFLQLFGDSPN